MKRVLDACCGSRMFYFDKADPEVLFADNRELETTLCDGRTLLVKPDIHMDFRNMPCLILPTASLIRIIVCQDSV